MKQQKREWMKRGQMIFIIVCLSFLLGSLGGSVAANIVGHSGKESTALFFKEALKSGTEAGFGYVFWKYLKYDLLIWLGGWLTSGIFLSGCVFLFRSVSLGFTSAMLMTAYGGKGILLSILAVLPQNLVLIPLYIFMMTASFYYASVWHENGARQRAGKREKRRKQTEYCILMGASLVALLLAVGIEVGVVSGFMRHLSFL